MKNTLTYQIVLFFRFMRLFRISLFSIVEVTSDKIRAIVAWDEDCKNGLPEIEDTQEVLWIIDDDNIIEDAILLGEYAYEANSISLDCLDINKGQIQKCLGWDHSRFQSAFHKLLTIRVKMIDNGKEGDSFFLHK